MHITIPSPASKPLPKVPKDDARGAPKRDQAHIRHDRHHEAARYCPRRDEFGEPVAPDVLVDRDGHEGGAGDGLVAVDGIGGGHGWECCDLHACTTVADDDDGL